MSSLPNANNGSSLHFSISDVSRMLSVSPSTLRQWQTMGLTSPTRTPGGYRSYSPEQVEWLKYIQHLRSEKNMNIDAIRHMLGTTEASKAADASSKSPSSAQIARKLRKLRKDHHLTLSEVAEKTGLSISFLSSIELGQANASVATLQKLSVLYETNVLSFFGNPKRNVKLVRPRQRKLLSNDKGIHIELLALGHLAMEPHLFRIAPGASSGGIYHHEGEEFIYMVSGIFEIWLDEVEHYELHAGDSLYFPSSQTHRWSNPGTRQSVLLWINTPPTF